MTFLTFRIDAMNYEALGRYTEAKERAERLALDVRLAMSAVSRLCHTSGTGRFAQAREYDFPAVRAEIDKAEAAYGAMLAAVSEANHEAPQCGRDAIKIAKW